LANTFIGKRMQDFCARFYPRNLILYGHLHIIWQPKNDKICEHSICINSFTKITFNGTLKIKFHTRKCHKWEYLLSFLWKSQKFRKIPRLHVMKSCEKSFKKLARKLAYEKMQAAYTTSRALFTLACFCKYFRSWEIDILTSS